MLPAMCLIKSVIVRLVDAGLFDFGNTILVGDGVTDDKFGTITVFTFLSSNTILANVGLVYTTNHDVVLKLVDGENAPVDFYSGKYFTITVEYEKYNNFNAETSYGSLSALPVITLT
jgi:hypothetical protein